MRVEPLCGRTVRAPLAEGMSEDVIARANRAEEQLRGEIERAGNTLTAHFSELEERLDRGERPAPPRTTP